MHAHRPPLSRSRLLAVVALLLALSLAASAPAVAQQPTHSISDPSPQAVRAAAVVALTAPAAEAAGARATVIRVVDGDTVRVAAGGASRTVRLLGADAPARGECFGAQAVTELRRLLPRGGAVRLTTDGRRRGVYVRRGGKLVNQAMLAGGFASADGVGGLRRGGALRAAEKRAEAAGRGLWSACQKPSNAPAGAPPGGAPATPAPVVAAPVATPRDLLTSALAGTMLRYFENSTGGCEFACFQSEQSLEYCTDGRFTRDAKFVESDPFGSTITQNHDEGTWRVRDATQAPDGTLAGVVELTLQRGTSVDSGAAALGSVQTLQISIAPDERTEVGSERWFRVTSEHCK